MYLVSYELKTKTKQQKLTPRHRALIVGLLLTVVFSLSGSSVTSFLWLGFVELQLLEVPGLLELFFFLLMMLRTEATNGVGCGVVAVLSEKSHEYKTLSTVVPCSL